MSDYPRDEFLATKLIIRYSVLTSSRKVTMESITSQWGEREEQNNSVMFMESCCFTNPLALIRGHTAHVDAKAPLKEQRLLCLDKMRSHVTQA